MKVNQLRKDTMSIPLQGCEAQDFIPNKCLNCNQVISHKGTSEYCTLKCFKASYKEHQVEVDTFRLDRIELDNYEWRVA